MERSGAFSEDAVWAVLEQMLDVLRVLHTRTTPIVHRDVKPRNIIRTNATSFALVDFGGVSSLRGSAGSTIVGTFGFMAPEQLYGAQAPATDIYALGATAIALATEAQPEELPRRGLGIDVDSAVPRLSAELRKTLCEMLEPDPAKRAGDADDLLARIAKRRRGGGGLLSLFKRAR